MPYDLFLKPKHNPWQVYSQVKKQTFLRETEHKSLRFMFLRAFSQVMYFTLSNIWIKYKLLETASETQDSLLTGNCYSNKSYHLICSFFVL